MTFLVLLLALQAPQEQKPWPEDEDPRGKFIFGPVVQYWLPRFTGRMQVDGEFTQGSNLHLTDELNLSDEAAIPIYGGGEIGVQLKGGATLTGVAEYWGHSWHGGQILKSPETLGDDTFAAGSSVKSRFSLCSTTLDIKLASGTDDLVRFGGYLSLQLTKARLTMDSPAVHARETIYDASWGFGGFLEFRPVRYVMVGVSHRMFFGFDQGDEEGGESFALDTRIYGAVEWRTFRLEGGYRINAYALDQSEQELRYTLDGAYVQASILLRF